MLVHQLYFFFFLWQKRPNFMEILTVLKSMNGDGGYQYSVLDIEKYHYAKHLKKYGMSIK